MVDRRLRLVPTEPPNGTLVASAQQHGSLTAAAGFPQGISNGAQGEGTQPWQEQAWGYYRSIGQLHQGIEWFSNSMSQVRLIAAEARSDSEIPTPLESGPAVDIISQLSWDSPSILRDLTIYKFVPGRGYLIGREPGKGQEREWTAYSANQVRLDPVKERLRKSNASIASEYQLQEDNKTWVSLSNALVVPVRTPDPQLKWMDTSPLESQLVILREIDLYNRDIISTLISRIANNGILLVPNEVTFPSKPGFNDGRDPFVLELIEAAKQAIKDPGSASAAIPLVLKVPGGSIEKFRHILLAAGVDESTLKAREMALGQLADGLPMPRENIVGGMADVNHWNGAVISQEAIKKYIAPFASDLCHDLTRGFMRPQLAANKESLVGPNGGRIVVWFDTTVLSAKPDRSDKAEQAYRNNRISTTAYLRELGFSESDIPSQEELRTQLLLMLIGQPNNALAAIEELTGSPITVRDNTSIDSDDVSNNIQDEPNPTNLPDETSPPTPDEVG